MKVRYGKPKSTGQKIMRVNKFKINKEKQKYSSIYTYLKQIDNQSSDS